MGKEDEKKVLRGEERETEGDGGRQKHEEASQWTGFEFGLSRDRGEANVMTALVPVITGAADTPPRAACWAPCKPLRVLAHSAPQ